MFKGKTIVICLSALAFLLTSTRYSLAQSASSLPSQPTKIQKYCTRAVASIDNILSQSNTRLTNRQKYIRDRKINIQKRITTLQNKGGDIVTLQNDSSQFFAQLDQWLSDYQKYLSLIQTARSLTCGSSDGGFTQTVQSARAQLKQVNQDSNNLKSFYQNTLNQDFANARLSIKNLGGSKNGANKTK